VITRTHKWCCVIKRMHYGSVHTFCIVNKDKIAMNTSLDNVFVRQIYKSLKYTYCSLSYLKSKKDVSSNPVHGEVYSIQHYVIKLVSDLRQVGGFLRVLRFPPPIKLTATILLKYCWKWRLNTITLTPYI
jgi:hypothetical protein